jgi:ATP-dependent Lhr-like helicase
VGNPEDLLGWLAGSCRGDRRIFLPPHSTTSSADVQLDFVGSLSNAAIVISRLHRGEKRLVFVDSRAGAEKLAAQLRQLDVSTFVTHSSLGPEQRHQAEYAFANRENCVIVATSVLELGIDVGDLDRVIQIDAPSTVSSFLQRMGRTGRRPGTTRNCLLLATDDESLIQAAGLIDLWSRQYVEPIAPPPLPYHIFAQQLMGLVLQQRGIAQDEAWRWLEGCRAFARMPAETRNTIVDWMLREQILFSDGGLLAFGPKGEEIFGRKNFLELFSVFLSPPLFTVLHGRQELGFVDELTFLGKKDGPRVLLLGGRSWLVKHVDWQRKIAHVEPTDAKGQSRWKGEGPRLGFALCQAVKRVLATDSDRESWSQRAVARIAELRRDHSWLTPDETVLLPGKGSDPEWWTFGGLSANAMLAGALTSQLESEVDYDNFALTFKGIDRFERIEAAIGSVRELDPQTLKPAIDPGAADGVKFSECLPPEMVMQMLSERLIDVSGAGSILAQPSKVRLVE